ncbi:YitT family protein [Hazenella sp. IB182357]|uniref:YitT family protein n=1 Tax=Polycladospora coralii TaxID=2771432 RepID=A0A926NFU7_9BACL|nr:YitT family protein [Polycladospora coralii]MBD1372774.1 YitT family protein [Polycladospora coralii]
MKNNWKLRTIAYVVGLIILGLGISLVIEASQGAGAWDALYVGLNKQFGLTVGTWLIIVGLVLVLINAILLKERLDWFAMLTLLLLGWVVDFWLYIIINTWQPALYWEQIGLLLVGMIVMAVGVSIYLQAKFAPTSVDKLMYAIAHRTGFSLRVSKTIGEVIALAFAWIAGGPIGLGTVLITFLVGPLVQFFIKRVEPLFAPRVKA